MRTHEFQVESDKLLTTILDAAILSKCVPENISPKNQRRLELIITPECNLRCKYCYLQKHAEELYPSRLRDHKRILRNLDKLLSYVEEQRWFFYEWDLFSGEIWHDDFGIEILDRILAFAKRYPKVRKIMIPTNGTFLYYPARVQRMLYYTREFDKLGIRFIISFSVDGFPLERKTRIDNFDEERRSRFYADMFQYTLDSQRHAGFHPMVSAIGIEAWPENFQWWMYMLDFFGLNNAKSPMMLEVRDDNWDGNAIFGLLELLDEIFEYRRAQTFKDDPVGLAKYFLGDPEYPNNVNIICQRTNFIPCSIQRSLFVRLGDLAIVPCHRLAYQNLNYGRFLATEAKIVGIQASNPEMAINVLAANPHTCFIKCDTCAFRAMCAKGCLGSQYETMREPFTPIPSVCDMYKAKFSFIATMLMRGGYLEALQAELPNMAPQEAAKYETAVALIREVTQSEDYRTVVQRYFDS